MVQQAVNYGQGRACLSDAALAARPAPRRPHGFVTALQSGYPLGPQLRAGLDSLTSRLFDLEMKIITS